MNRLPDDILGQISTYCYPQAIWRLRQVNSRIRHAVQQALEEYTIPFVICLPGLPILVGRFFFQTFQCKILGIADPIRLIIRGGKAITKECRDHDAERAGQQICEILAKTPIFPILTAEDEERFYHKVKMERVKKLNKQKHYNAFDEVKEASRREHKTANEEKSFKEKEGGGGGDGGILNNMEHNDDWGCVDQDWCMEERYSPYLLLIANEKTGTPLAADLEWRGQGVPIVGDPTREEQEEKEREEKNRMKKLPVIIRAINPTKISRPNIFHDADYAFDSRLLCEILISNEESRQGEEKLKQQKGQGNETEARWEENFPTLKKIRLLKKIGPSWRHQEAEEEGKGKNLEDKNSFENSQTKPDALSHSPHHRYIIPSVQKSEVPSEEEIQMLEKELLYYIINKLMGLSSDRPTELLVGPEDARYIVGLPHFAWFYWKQEEEALEREKQKEKETYHRHQKTLSAMTTSSTTTTTNTTRTVHPFLTNTPFRFTNIIRMRYCGKTELCCVRTFSDEGSPINRKTKNNEGGGDLFIDDIIKDWSKDSLLRTRLLKVKLRWKRPQAFLENDEEAEKGWKTRTGYRRNWHVCVGESNATGQRIVVKASEFQNHFLTKGNYTHNITSHYVDDDYVMKIARLVGSAVGGGPPEEHDGGPPQQLVAPPSSKIPGGKKQPFVTSPPSVTASPPPHPVIDAALDAKDFTDMQAQGEMTNFIDSMESAYVEAVSERKAEAPRYPTCMMDKVGPDDKLLYVADGCILQYQCGEEELSMKCPSPFLQQLHAWIEERHNKKNGSKSKNGSSGAVQNDEVVKNNIEVEEEKFSLHDAPEFLHQKPWFLWGPPGTFSTEHVEQDDSHVWVYLFQGAKLWFVLLPENEGEKMDNDVYGNPLNVHQEMSWKYFVQREGELVFMLPRVRHIVLNLEPSWAVATNFELPKPPVQEM